MDFNKFCENGKEIKLTEEKKSEIINICKENDVRKYVFVSMNFKRIAAAACALIIAVTAVFVYKNHKNSVDVPIYGNTEKSVTEDSKAIEASSVYTTQKIEYTTECDRSEESLPVTTQKEQKPDQGGAELLPRKYRNNYYSVPASFSKIVGRAAYSEWEDEYLAENYPDDSNEMVMVAYVKAFDISKEDFERANLEYAKFIRDTYSHICLDPQDYADQEMQEIYNADIIYTFDNEVINEYYLGIDYPFLNEYQYVDALEAGTYKTRTTQFITVEQMEAEIIAKYGEAEIATEITTVPEEAVTTNLLQIETIE
ncbi:MAG: hypothetical protein IJE19_10100 [Clostridia bacterium]|nr:hypothetical protein [Clostridia bacterium]